MPYAAPAQEDSTAEPSALHNEWADHLASARQDAVPRAAWRNDKGHIWNSKGDGLRRGLGTSQIDSSTASSPATSDNTDLSSLQTGRALDFHPPSSPSNYGSQRGGAWENSWGGWPDAQMEDHTTNTFRGFHTMRKDAPASFDPPAPTPEPAYAVFLPAGFFGAARFFYRRFQFHP